MVGEPLKQKRRFWRILEKILAARSLTRTAPWISYSLLTLQINLRPSVGNPPWNHPFANEFAIKLVYQHPTFMAQLSRLVWRANPMQIILAPPDRIWVIWFIWSCPTLLSRKGQMRAEVTRHKNQGHDEGTEKHREHKPRSIWSLAWNSGSWRNSLKCISTRQIKTLMVFNPKANVH